MSVSGGGVDEHHDGIERRVGRIEDRIDVLVEKVDGLQRFQAWITGIAVGAGAVMGLFIDSIKRKLGL